ncbi:Crp/Fnr family transcriptional regulator [Entomobacter blattae]|uniref:Crp/Fnr family transcriptional regulator n=1 Tax=Entomobacter blattae TaxID=2762277 RepID=UPI00193C39EF|nr:cyclic nucleotide-binding domain-containing protein [Entomobacter blattae]
MLQEKEEILKLNTITNTMNVSPGKILMEEGEEALNYFSVSSGTVKLFKLMPDGRRHIIGFAGAGHFLGLTNDGKYSYSAEVLEETRLCRFSHSKLEQLFDLYPSLRKEILKEAINLLAFSQDQMLLLGRKTSQEKVASFLVVCRGKDIVENTVISLPMTRLDIADYLGLTMETVSRTFGWLKKQKMISFLDSHHVKIENPTALYDLAMGNG